MWHCVLNKGGTNHNHYMWKLGILHKDADIPPHNFSPQIFPDILPLQAVPAHCHSPSHRRSKGAEASIPSNSVQFVGRSCYLHQEYDIFKQNNSKLTNFLGLVNYPTIIGHQVTKKPNPFLPAHGLTLPLILQKSLARL